MCAAALMAEGRHPACIGQTPAFQFLSSFCLNTDVLLMHLHMYQYTLKMKLHLVTNKKAGLSVRKSKPHQFLSFKSQMESLPGGAP